MKQIDHISQIHGANHVRVTLFAIVYIVKIKHTVYSSVVEVLLMGPDLKFGRHTGQCFSSFSHRVPSRKYFPTAIFITVKF